MGPITGKTLTNQRRFICEFIDDYSHFTMCYIVYGKIEVFEVFKEYYSWARTQFNNEYKIKTLRCDTESEYINIKNYCQVEYIEFNLSELSTPQHNGTAERFNRTLQEKVRALLFIGKLPTTFWGLAVYVGLQ